MADLSWDQVFAWRMRRQFLELPGPATAIEIVERLAGIQAQVASNAEQAVTLRQAEPAPGQVERALADRELVKTWAMRGTLHLLPVASAGAYLALVGAARTWQKAAWQRTFVDTRQLAALTEAVLGLLDSDVLTREDLIEQVIQRTGDEELAEQLRSGWSAVLKPLAWQGLLCQGPPRGARITFARPDRWLPRWRGLPDPEEAARIVIPAYLGAHGPATPDVFDQWLVRGVSKNADLRAWFAGLAGELATVRVEGTEAYVRAVDVDELAATRPSTVVRLLPGFDQYVLGPGTADPRLIAPARRAEVSRAAGWISPVVVVDGRVAGTWQATGGVLEISLFSEAEPLPHEAIEAEAARVDPTLTLSVRMT